MIKNILYCFFILSAFIGLPACSTTTKTVTSGYSVESGTQLERARAAFNQKNYFLAAKLLDPLAKQGEGYAQYALGYMYYNGMGVPRNRKLANQLLNASASNGNKNAIEALRLISATASDTSNSESGVTTTPPTNPEQSIASEEVVVESEQQTISEESISEKSINEDSEKVTGDADSLTESEK